MLRYLDFVPRQTGTKKVLIFSVAIYEDFSLAVEAAGEWIDFNSLDVVNVETVVLPNLHSVAEDGSSDPDLVASGERSTSWYQLVRVWYRSEEEVPPPIVKVD